MLDEIPTSSEIEKSIARESLYGGRYLGRGVGSAITGMGANWIIADDLIKNRKEAQSPKVRDNVWNFLNDDLLTRLEYPGSILIMMTRWHHDDPVGRLLDEEPDKWTVLNFPEVLTEEKYEQKHEDDPRELGEVLWPGWFKGEWEFVVDDGETPEDVPDSIDRDPEPVTTEQLHERGRQQFLDEKDRNPRGAAALWQNDPSTDEGDFFDVDDFDSYARHPSKVELDEKLISVDCTFRDTDDSDFVVAQVWGRENLNFFLLDQNRERTGIKGTYEMVLNLAQKWPDAYVKLIEGKANGDAVLEILEDKVHGLKRFNPTAGKDERAQVAAWEADDGHIHLPAAQFAPWLSEFKSEFKEYPSGAHDDQVDACSQAMIWWTHSQNDNPAEHIDRILGKG